MADFQENMSFLTKQVVENRLMGYTMEEVADKVGISTEEAVTEWKNYVASRYVMPKEEQWLLHLMRLENLMTKVHAKLEHSTMVEDFNVLLNLLDRIEALQSLNLSRKEVAALEAEKVQKLLAEQVIGILEATRSMTQEMIERAFQQKTLKAAKAALLEDLGEYTNKALTTLEDEVEED
jgi:hypothetical protein